MKKLLLTLIAAVMLSGCTMICVKDGTSNKRQNYITIPFLASYEMETSEDDR